MKFNMRIILCWLQNLILFITFAIQTKIFYTDMNNSKYTVDSTVRLIIRVLTVMGVILLLRYLSDVLLPFFIGWFIAYLIYPLVSFFQYKMRVKNRMVAVLMALLSLLGVLVGACFAVVPIMYAEVSKVLPMMVDYFNEIGKNDFINSTILSRWQNSFGTIDYNNIFSLQTIEVIADKFVPQFWGLVTNVWNIIIGSVAIFMIVLYLTFILVDYEKLNEGLINIFPKKYRRFVGELKNDLSLSMNKYFRGQIVICLIVGVLYVIGFYIIGVPMALLLGATIGILHIVPYLQTVGFIPVLFFSFLGSQQHGGSFSMMILAVFVLFLLIQMINDFVLTPKIMGKNMGLKPAIILLSLSVFGMLFGLLGLIIALPVATMVISYYQRFVIDKESVVDDGDEVL